MRLPFVSLTNATHLPLPRHLSYMVLELEPSVLFL